MAASFRPGRKDKGKEKAEDESSIRFWTRGERLAQGGFATVYLATNTETGDVFIAKMVDAADKEKRMALENERRILKRCSSPYVVKYLGWNTAKDIDTRLTNYNLFEEYIQRGTVAAHIERNGGALEEPIVAAYTREVLRGLNYLHNKLNIVHGDLKCDNMLVGPEHIKLCDLGSGKIMREGDLVLPPMPGFGSRRRIFVTGTRGWMAPEVEGEYRQDYKSDIYSLGCCVVEMCVGQPPAKEPELYAFEDDFEEGDEELLHELTMDIPPNFSKACRDFVGMCFREDPDDRPDTDELLESQWIATAPKYPAYKPLPYTRAVPPRPKTFCEHVRNWFGCKNASWVENCRLCCRCDAKQPCVLRCCTCLPETHNCPTCCECLVRPCELGCCTCPPCLCNNPRKRRRRESQRLAHLL